MEQTALDKSLTYASTNWEQFMDDFKNLLRIPSVSTDPAYKDDVRRTAEWIRNEMVHIGLHNCQLLESGGHPAVYGEWLDAGSDQPTILIYAHYDTQPIDPLELWITPPFEPSVRDGYIYARGAIDDKAGVHIHLKAVESILMSTGKLPANIKFFFEGEEESSSSNIIPLIRQHKDLLDADLLVISDGGGVDDQPFIITSVRGITSGEVKVRGPKIDLHSGSYGGVVNNPAHVVAKIVAAVHGPDGRIQVPGFYDNVQRLTPTELESLADEEEVEIKIARDETGLEEFWGVEGYSFIERQTALPTFDVNGLYSGYQGIGNKTIIPSEAGFKASMRLAAGQEPDDIAEKFTRFVRKFECPGIQIEINTQSDGRAVQFLFDGPVMDAIQNIYQITYGKRALLCRQGGSVPVMSTMQDELKIPMINLGFGNGKNGHAPNECASLKYLRLDLETAIRVYYAYSESVRPKE